MRCGTHGMLWICLAACSMLGCEASTDVAEEPVAHATSATQGASVTPEEVSPKVSLEESLLLPGSGLVPSFDAPAPGRTPPWRWVYNTKSPQYEGLAQDQVQVSVSGTSLTCTFLAKKMGVGCEPSSLTPGIKAWSHRFEDDLWMTSGQMIAAGSTVYVTRHSYIATGASLMAYDALTGDELWSVSLKGLVDIAHSRYRNETYLEYDADTDSVLVFGKESGGGYVERRAVKDGALLAHHAIDSWSANQEPSAPIVKDASRHYKNQESVKFPGGKERLILSDEGKPIALHTWPPHQAH